MAPVSQMIADDLRPATAKELSFVAPLGEAPDDPRARGPGVTAILLEHQSKLLSDEFRSRHAALPCGARQEPVVNRVEGDGRSLLSG
jgi:hypothetical protein